MGKVAISAGPVSKAARGPEMPDFFVLNLRSREDCWSHLPTLLATLPSEARAAVAYLALHALPREDAIMVVEAALDVGRSPLPPLLGAMDEAAFWSKQASSTEREAYCLACFDRMSAERQKEFLKYIEQRGPR